MTIIGEQAEGRKRQIAILGAAIVAATAFCFLGGMINLSRQVADDRGLWIILGLEFSFLVVSFSVYLLIKTRNKLWRRLVFGAIAGLLSSMLAVLIAANMVDGEVPEHFSKYTVFIVASVRLLGWLFGMAIGFFYHCLWNRMYRLCALALGGFFGLALASIVAEGLGRHAFDWHWYDTLL